VIRGALQKANVAATDRAAVGITNQRETTVVWDRSSGKPYANALVWQDTRTDELVAEFSREGGQDRFRAATGLPLATYFSGPKIGWLLRSRGPMRAAAKRGDALFEYRYLADRESHGREGTSPM
jgi:glycerol kinase